MYGYRCEYCNGVVQPRVVEHEAFKHKTSRQPGQTWLIF